MDDLDISILRALKQDGRMPFTMLAEQLDSSEGTIRTRVKKLMEAEIIRQFTVRTTGFGVKSLLDVSIDRNVNTSNISTRIAEIAGVESVYETAGDFDITVVIHVANIGRLNDIIEEIRGFENTSSTRTRMILKEIPVDEPEFYWSLI